MSTTYFLVFLLGLLVFSATANQKEGHGTSSEWHKHSTGHLHATKIRKHLVELMQKSGQGIVQQEMMNKAGATTSIGSRATVKNMDEQKPIKKAKVVGGMIPNTLEKLVSKHKISRANVQSTGIDKVVGKN